MDSRLSPGEGVPHSGGRLCTGISSGLRTHCTSATPPVSYASVCHQKGAGLALQVLSQHSWGYKGVQGYFQPCPPQCQSHDFYKTPTVPINPDVYKTITRPPQCQSILMSTRLLQGPPQCQSILMSTRLLQGPPQCQSILISTRLLQGPPQC